MADLLTCGFSISASCGCEDYVQADVLSTKKCWGEVCSHITHHIVTSPHFMEQLVSDTITLRSPHANNKGPVWLLLLQAKQASEL